MKKELIAFGILLIFAVIVLVSPNLLGNFLERITGKAVSELSNFQVNVGDEEYVYGPTWYIDSPFFTERTTTGLRGYMANAKTMSFFGQNLNWMPEERIAFEEGANGKFDECGRWLLSVYKLTESHWLGWYHAEEDCDYNNNGETVRSVGFAESFTAGYGWSFPNYPNNRVLTINPNQISGVNSGVGDAKVLREGDYFYMFFRSTYDWKVHLARSLVSDEGRPGTWEKYYNGNFGEPGLGGLSSALSGDVPGRARFVVYNNYLDSYLTFYDSGKTGFYFYLSEDMVSWEKYPEMIYPLVSYEADGRVDKWHPMGDMQVYAYPSTISPEGNSNEIGREFYIYYMKIFPGDSGRYLLRRKITLEKGSDDYLSKVALTEYVKSGKTKVSTEIPKNRNYQKTENLGYLLTYPRMGFRPLYDCWIANWDDSLITTIPPNNWEYCEGSTGSIFTRTIGYISETQIEGTAPLYRCFDSSAKNHFVSTNEDCGGKTMEWRLGYMFLEPAEDCPGGCEDNNLCTDDSCVNHECNHGFNSNPCDDDNLCTGDDVCNLGVCSGTQKNCNDGDLCTIDSCVDGNCQHLFDNNIPGCACNNNLDCIDSNLCTDHSCVNHDCIVSYNTDSCDDGDTCTVEDVCSEGQCMGESKNCNDGLECSIDSCINGFCQFDTSNCGCENNEKCDDNNHCTNDSCVGGSCVNEFNGLDCNDNNPCTVNDACSEGLCIGVWVGCDDNLPCSRDYCENGNCIYDQSNCDCDNNADCEDNNKCTDNYCESETRECKKTYNDDKKCDDKSDNTINDKCNEGKCVGESICNANGICDGGRGEDCENCPSDCGGCPRGQLLQSNVPLSLDTPTLSRALNKNLWGGIIILIVLVMIVLILLFVKKLREKLPRPV